MNIANTFLILYIQRRVLIKLESIYKYFICFLTLINLNKARKIQIIKETNESIPKDSKHPKNQYFWEYLYTAQNAAT